MQVETDSKDHMRRMVQSQRQRAGFAMHPYFYASEVTFETELSEILFKSWLYAGHASQVSNPGDFVQYRLGRDAVVICRDLEGALHALVNTCRHRGARVCEDQSGSCEVFVCPYHGWVYDLDGTLRFAREMDAVEGFDASASGLKRVRLIEFEGLIFINCDPGAEDFRADLLTIEPMLKSFDLPGAKVAASRTYTVDANWKLALENYTECYHCAPLHPAYAKLHSISEPRAEIKALTKTMLERCPRLTGLSALTGESAASYNSARCEGGGVYYGRYALFGEYVTGSADGAPLAPLMGRYQGYDGGAGDFGLGPLAFMLGYPDHCVLYRFTPREVHKTDMEVIWLVRGDAIEGQDYQESALTWLWHQTTLEDVHIVKQTAEGVRSHFFEPGPFHPEREQFALEFIDWYLQRLGRAS